MAEKSKVSKNGILEKVKKSFSVQSPGGVSHIASRFQDGVDFWVDLVFDQLDKDLGTIKKGILFIIKETAKQFEVSGDGKIAGFFAFAVDKTDRFLNIFGDNADFQFKRAKENLGLLASTAWKNKTSVMKYSAALLLIYIAITGTINYTTGYEYSYNGRTLGIVKQQEDVFKVIDVAATGLAKEYGVDVQLDEKEDFTFRKVSTWNEKIDSSDDVLNKLTYMQDTEIKAYGIFVDDEKAAVVSSKETAEDILEKLKSQYVDEDEKSKYDSVDFKENVEIREMNTAVGKLMTENTAFKLLNNDESKIKHVVKLGETVSSIAKAYGISEEKFYSLNPELSESQGTLKEGEVVTVINKSPDVTVVTKVTKTYTKSVKYKVKRIKSDSLYEGDTEVSVKGKNGRKKITAQVVYENGNEVKRDILKTKVVKDSVTKIILVGTKERPATVGSGDLINPCPAGYQSSGFGQRWGRLHRGIDLACAVGNNIYAADGGTVITASYNASYGNYIKIDHQNGMITTYAHCSQLCVSVGDKVYQGQVIAKVGNTGNSTGAHCHFEVEVNGTLQNPNNYV